MNLNLGLISMFRYGNNASTTNVYRNINPFEEKYNQNPNRNNKFGNDAVSAARMLSDSYQRKMNNLQNQGSNIVSDSLGYANSLTTSRVKAKNTATQIKKLQYDFKGISSQILKCRTSLNAKQVAGKARREVLRLKRQKGSGEYDDEELQSAILHAQAMERVAKKKVRHLQEEEMIRAASGRCAGSLEENEETEDFKRQTDEFDETLQEKMEEMAGQYWESIQDTMEKFSDSLSGALDDVMQETMEEVQKVMEEMQDSMESLMEETSLKELIEELGGGEVIEKDMDPADFKMMKIKHRSDEIKEIAKADGEYLKAMFKRYEKMKEEMSSKGGGVFNSSFSGENTFPSAGASRFASVSISEGGVDAGCVVSGGIDVSV